jgi:uncharacterized protein YecE (DUF72 family)
VAPRPVHVGCSGWNYRDWRGTVYPPGCPASRWLSHYATLFGTVEVNATFYRLQRPAAVARWVEQTPPEFVFAAKGSRYLTHMKRLTDMGDGLRRFYDSIAPLVGSGKLGPVLWQLPERMARDDERLAAALDALPPGLHAVELRHPSWFCEPVYALLRAAGAALVVGDHPARPWQATVMTSNWTYVRFHHGHRGRRGNYSETELRAWAERIGGWRRDVEVYAYFNNDWEGFAVRNATRLRALLG